MTPDAPERLVERPIPDTQKFKATIAIFRKYGDKYGLDWMLMAAQGY